MKVREEDGDLIIEEEDDSGNTAIIYSINEEQVEVSVLIGEMELMIIGLRQEGINSWIVHDVDVWVDRRTPWDFTDVDLPVAKLQAYDEVKPLLAEVVKIWSEKVSEKPKSTSTPAE